MSCGRASSNNIQRKQQNQQNQPTCGGLPYLPAESSVGFGPQFAPAAQLAAFHAPGVMAATSAEIRNGYPMSSYVALDEAVQSKASAGVPCDSDPFALLLAKVGASCSDNERWGDTCLSALIKANGP